MKVSAPEVEPWKGQAKLAEAEREAVEREVAVGARVAEALGGLGEEGGELDGEPGVGGVEGFGELEDLGLGGVGDARAIVARVVGVPAKSVPGSAAVRVRPAACARRRRARRLGAVMVVDMGFFPGKVCREYCSD